MHIYQFISKEEQENCSRMNLDMTVEKANQLITLYTEELLQLQDIYGPNFTSNMFENMACWLGRSRSPSDVYYYLPWVQKDSDNNDVLCQVSTMQLTFFVKVKDINHISLMCKSNNNLTTVLESQAVSNPNNNIFKFNKTINNASTTENIAILAEGGHIINKEWFDSQYQVTTDKITPNYIIFKDFKLQRFEEYYDTVRIFIVVFIIRFIVINHIC